MYDDDYPSPTSAETWYDEERPERLVHLCPACRDLMSAVITTARRLPEATPEPDWSRALRWLDAHSENSNERGWLAAGIREAEARLK